MIGVSRGVETILRGYEYKNIKPASERGRYWTWNKAMKEHRKLFRTASVPQQPRPSISQRSSRFCFVFLFFISSCFASVDLALSTNERARRLAPASGL